MSKLKDLTGKRFGRLVVIENTGEKKNRSYLWVCRCDCGNEITVTSSRLNNGVTQSCGCLRIKDITGERFGRLVAIENMGTKNKHGCYMWLFKCDCGNETILSPEHLASGYTKSCGCLKKENGLKSAEIMNKSEGAKEFIKKDTQETGTRINSIQREDANKNNASGKLGVSWNKKHEKWVAYLNLKGKQVFNKMFEDKQDAINARKEAEEKYFKPILEKYGKTQ